LLIKCLDVMKAPVLWRLWSILLTGGCAAESQGPLYSETAPELGGQKAAVPKMNDPHKQKWCLCCASGLYLKTIPKSSTCYLSVSVLVCDLFSSQRSCNIL